MYLVKVRWESFPIVSTLRTSDLEELEYLCSNIKDVPKCKWVPGVKCMILVEERQNS
jgi:hypothetical protein